MLDLRLLGGWEVYPQDVPFLFFKFLHFRHLGTNKNARRLKEAHIAQNLKGIKILDRAGEDLKELERTCSTLKNFR